TPGTAVTVAGLPHGPVDFAAEAVGYVTEDGLGRLLDSTDDEVRLVLVKEKMVRVEVKDAVTRRPLEPRVTRRTAGKTHPVARGGEFTNVLLLRLPADARRHRLVFELEGYETAVLDLPDLRGVEETPQFEVPMTPAAEGETGSFFIAVEGERPERITVVGRTGGPWPVWVRHVESDDEGRWPVRKVPVGDYRVTVLAPGKIPVVLERVSVARNLQDTHRVVFTDGGGLSFRVQDEGGNLLDKVQLVLHDADGVQVDVQVYNRVSDGSAYVSVNYIPTAAAAHSDSGLAPGSYSLAVGRREYEPVRQGFTIRGTETAELTFVLKRR
ncbi:MAG: carboxypeptidase-like regulatory domain-containing protein, partial [Planctomycetota bacterium]